MQRITDMRMSGSSLKSLRIFEKIYGERNFQNVVIVTTMWSSLKTKEARDAALMRQKMMEERPEFFGNLTRAGARMERCLSDSQSGIRIVELLADTRKTVVLQLQHEMRGAKMKLEGTTAGKYLEGELASTRKMYEAQKRELEECAEEAHDDEDLRSEFFEQVDDYTRLVNNIINDQGSLSVTLEDMRNEQAAWCSVARNDQVEDNVHENNSARIFELELEVQGLKRVIEEQRVEGLLAQQEGIERIEAAKKEIAEAKERDQVARDKAKERRAPQSEVVLWMRNFFAGRHLENSVQLPRRADSMPVETRAPKKPGTKSWQKPNRSKGRHSRRPNIMRTSSDDQTKQPYIVSHDFHDQYTNEPGHSGVSESDYESDTENSAPPMYTLQQARSYPPAALSASNGQYYVPPHEVSIDSTKPMRVPPSPPQPPLRRVPHSAGPPHHQVVLRSPSYLSTPPGDPNYRG